MEVAGTRVDGGIGVTAVFSGDGVDAGVELGMVMPTAVVAQRGDDPSGGGGRLNDASKRCRMVARWGDFAVRARRKETTAGLAFAVGRIGAVVAKAAVACSQSSPACGGDGDRHGVLGKGRRELGKMGKRGEGASGIVYMGSKR